ncbi:hypothetical protein EON67_11455 [archaeon]|nr:MAG: hypothetical protein EON67_11455 [archaeon]
MHSRRGRLYCRPVACTVGRLPPPPPSPAAHPYSWPRARTHTPGKMMNPDVSMRPTILLLREGTDTSQVRHNKSCRPGTTCSPCAVPQSCPGSWPLVCGGGTRAAARHRPQVPTTMCDSALRSCTARARTQRVAGATHVGEWLAVDIVPPITAAVDAPRVHARVPGTLGTPPHTRPSPQVAHTWCMLA